MSDDVRDAAEILREIAGIAQTPLRDVTPEEHALFASFPVLLTSEQMERVAEWLDDLVDSPNT